MKNFIASLLFIFSFNLFASSAVEIQNARVRLTPPNAPATAIFMTIVNKSDKDLKLVKINGDFAGKFELHNMEMAGGKMVMRAVDFIEVKKKSSTELGTGGFHVMVFNLKKPLQEKETYKFELIFDDKTHVNAEAKVEKI